MKLGAEPKKVVILAGLSLVGAYLFYTNVLSQPGAPAPPRDTPRPQASPAPGAAAPARPVAKSAPKRGGAFQEFRPSLKPRRPEDRPDPALIDPTLRLDLLAKLQTFERAGPARNLFQFSTPPPPKTPDVKIVPKTPEQIARENAPAPAATPPPPAPPAKPPAPPINLKFYGYSTLRREGRKRAFFLDGDDILVAEEGEVVKRRYKVVRIGVSSVVMEDMESKSQQTLPMLEETT